MPFYRQYIVFPFFVFVLWPTLSVAENLSINKSLRENPYQSLLDKYQHLKPLLFSNSFGEPVYIESDFEKNMTTGHVFALVAHPYATLKSTLVSAADWCAVTMLHLNVKGCKASRDENQQSYMTLYVGKKSYQDPDDAYPVKYRYEASSNADNYLRVSLTSDAGPFGTSDYTIAFEAIPFDESSSFIHFSYSYRNGFFARLALNTYLATAGSHKVGFSIQEYDVDDQPVYVKGMQGVIERNVMRYFLAIQSYLDTYAMEDDDQLHLRLMRWYDLTQRFSKQLYEIERAEYIEMKQKEFNSR